jgi:carbamoyl-phosphate synthase large subunit
MKKLKVLVTGCGGDIGQSIGKILIENDWVIDLHGFDITDKNAAKFIFPTFQTVPKVTDNGYIDFISNYVRNHEIDLVIPIAEPELRYYALKGWNEQDIGTKVLLTNEKALSVGFDKMKTARFLASNGLKYPITSTIASSKNRVQLPVIFKSRTGSGSRSIIHVKDASTFDFYKKLYQKEDFIIQEFIPADEGEYTCGLFRSCSGEIRTIIFLRELTGGYSGYGEIVESENINKLLKNLAEALDLRGSINVQMRLRDGVPLVFEINPRFSSTVYFRHMFGFEDVIWSIADLFKEPIPPYNPNTKTSRFYKGFNEYID